jgi:drug/metabolite transporter (DMT)-like permease
MIDQINLINYIGGILLALLATLFFNYAPLLTKMALNQIEEIKATNFWVSTKRMITNKKWLSGLGLTFIGGTIYLLALNIAGVTVVEPLLNFGFIVLAFMAYRLLGEKLDKKAKLAIIILIIMPFMISLGGVTPAVSIDESNMLWFSVGCIFIISILFFISRKVAVLWAITTGITMGMSAIYTQWFIYLFFQGWTNSGNIIIAFSNAIIPFLLMIVIGFVAGFVFNQIGLQKNPTSVFNPINGTTNTCIGILGGLLIFGQTVANWSFYIIGFVLGIIGVILLGRYQGELSPNHREK